MRSVHTGGLNYGDCCSYVLADYFKDLPKRLLKNFADIPKDASSRATGLRLVARLKC